MLGKGKKQNKSMSHFSLHYIVILIFDCSHVKVRRRDQRSKIFERPHRIRTVYNGQMQTCDQLAFNRLEKVDELMGSSTWPRVFIPRTVFLGNLVSFPLWK